MSTSQPLLSQRHLHNTQIARLSQVDPTTPTIELSVRRESIDVECVRKASISTVRVICTSSVRVICTSARVICTSARVICTSVRGHVYIPISSRSRGHACLHPCEPISSHTQLVPPSPSPTSPSFVSGSILSLLCRMACAGCCVRKCRHHPHLGHPGEVGEVGNVSKVSTVWEPTLLYSNLL